MRLSGLLSKEPSKEFCQIDGFLNSELKNGRQRKIKVGTITLSFYCKDCEDTLTFSSIGESLMCIGINEKTISVDTVLKCPRCNNNVPVWFLVESDEKSFIVQYPNVRILKRSYKLFDNICINKEKYGKYSELLEKANRAYSEELGAGAIVYLRKVYEQIVTETAKIYGINMRTPKGGRRKFEELLKEVDSEASIVPLEFAQNGYTLFQRLSNVIHGEYDEKIALKQFPAFYRLVVGILDKINNNKELLKAIEELELNEKGGKND